MVTHVRWFVGSALTIVVGLMVGCAPTPDVCVPDVGAKVRVHEGTVTLTRDGAEVEPSDGTALSAGDVLETSGGEAMVDVVWADGSLTRLGPATTFTVGASGGPGGVRGEQTGGVTWNRVSPDAVYAIDVPDAGRTRDRGDLFVVDCRGDVCRIAATGGLGGDGSLYSLRREGVDTVVDSARLATWNELMADEWAIASAALDESAGLPPVEALFADADPSRGVLEGTFDVVRTGRERDCSGPACDRLVLLAPGAVRELVFEFHLDCLEASECLASVDTQTINTNDGSLLDATAPLVVGAEEYSWGTDGTIPVCIWTNADGSTVDVGTARNVVRWQVIPTQAEVRDGRFVVTELTGTTQSSLETIERTGAEYPGCEQFEVDWSGASDLVLTKRGD